MEFINETKIKADWTMGFGPDGRELLVVAVKATFEIPQNGEAPALADEQVSLTQADVFTGEPGSSATLYESDYAHHKPFCDVLLNGSAYVPGGRPRGGVRVALKVGAMIKTFNVVGDRKWERSIVAVKPTPHKPFFKMPISYDRAYGGADQDPGKAEKIKTYTQNPIGVGYYPFSTGKLLVGKPLPNTEEIGKPIKRKNGQYRPMALGPSGRNFQFRIPYAGTYDQAWLDKVAPFWPDDFDYRYFQAAPPDQQIPHPKGGEPVVLQNLTPGGWTRFQLPRISMPVIFVPYHGGDIFADAVMDTIVIEPDHNRFMLTWRWPLPLMKSCFELKQVIVGEKPQSWRWKRNAAAKGKAYYKGIAAYINSKKAG